MWKVSEFKNSFDPKIISIRDYEEKSVNMILL
jgi:hypothetical protein